MVEKHGTKLNFNMNGLKQSHFTKMRVSFSGSIRGPGAEAKADHISFHNTIEVGVKAAESGSVLEGSRITGKPNLVYRGGPPSTPTAGSSKRKFMVGFSGGRIVIAESELRATHTKSGDTSGSAVVNLSIFGEGHDVLAEKIRESFKDLKTFGRYKVKPVDIVSEEEPELDI